MNSCLYLKTVKHNNGTRLEDVFCTAPYRDHAPVHTRRPC